VRAIAQIVNGKRNGQYKHISYSARAEYGLTISTFGVWTMADSLQKSLLLSKTHFGFRCLQLFRRRQR
jgi:hypothetical protein